MDDDSGFAPHIFLEHGAHVLDEVRQLMALYASEATKLFAEPAFGRARAQRAAYAARLPSAGYSYAEPYVLVKRTPPPGLFRVRVLQLVPEVRHALDDQAKAVVAASMALMAELDKHPANSALRRERLGSSLYGVTRHHEETRLHVVFTTADRGDYEETLVLNVVVGELTTEDISESRTRRRRWMESDD